MHVGIVMGSDSDLPAMKKHLKSSTDLALHMTLPLLPLTARQRNWLNLLRQKKKKAQAHSLPALAWQQPFRVW